MTAPITSPSTILGQGYNQCYPPTGVTESGSYYIDSYEASITGEAGTLTGGATSAELLQTTIELGCVLNALNIQSPQSGTSALNYLLTNAASKATAGNDGILSGQKNLIEGPYEVSVITLLTTSLSAPSPLSGIIFTIYPHPMTIDGYKWNTGILPNINTINANSTFDSSSSNSISVLGQLTDELAQIVYNSTDDDEDDFSSLALNNSDENDNSSANSNSSNEPGTQGPSSMSSTTNSSNNAAAAIASTALCAKYETESEISEDYLDVESNPENGGPEVNVGGASGKWSPVLSCVAQKLQMPTLIKTELKVRIAQSSAAVAKGQNSNLGGINANWNLSNGGKIYLVFWPADLMQHWEASFTPTNQQ